MAKRTKAKAGAAAIGDTLNAIRAVLDEWQDTGALRLEDAVRVAVETAKAGEGFKKELAELRKRMKTAEAMAFDDAQEDRQRWRQLEIERDNWALLAHVRLRQRNNVARAAMAAGVPGTVLAECVDDEEAHLPSDRTGNAGPYAAKINMQIADITGSEIRVGDTNWHFSTQPAVSK